MRVLTLRPDARHIGRKLTQGVDAAGAAYGERSLPFPDGDGDPPQYEDLITADALGQTAGLDARFHQLARRLDAGIVKAAADSRLAVVVEGEAAVARDRAEQQLAAFDGEVGPDQVRRSLSNPVRLLALAAIAGGDALLTMLAMQLFGGTVLESAGAALAVMVALLALASVFGGRLREGVSGRVTVVAGLGALAGIVGIAGLRSALLAQDGENPFSLLPWFLGIQLVLFIGAVFVEYLHHNPVADQRDHLARAAGARAREWRARAGASARLTARAETLSDRLVRLEWEFGAHKRGHLHRATKLRAQFRCATTLSRPEPVAHLFPVPLTQVAEPAPGWQGTTHGRLFSARHVVRRLDEAPSHARSRTPGLNGHTPALPVARKGEQ